MLEGADHHDARIAGKNILGAVAVMHVEIDDRGALETVHRERVRDADGDVVEQAEAHGPIAHRRDVRAGARRRTRSHIRRA